MNILIIPDNIKGKLLNYQIKHVENLIYSLKKYNRALDASDTGTGKTYTSIATCISMNLKPFIICPKSVLSSWKKILNSFNASYYGITNYELIQNCRYFAQNSGKQKIKCPFINRIENIKKDKKGKIRKNKKKINDIKDGIKKEEIEYTYIWNLPDNIILIFDEAHRCKNPRTGNSVLLYTASKNKTTKILILSATVSDKPENFALCGYTLGLYKSIAKVT